MPPRFSQSGELEPRVRQALNWLQQNQVDVFWGRIHPSERILKAIWDEDIVPDVEGFLFHQSRDCCLSFDKMNLARW
jgi:hypothetical protein